jgi:endoglycosylceramidase
VTPDGQVSPIVQSLSRAYPQAVAGTPVSFSFDPGSREFHLLYVPNQSIAAPTVIFVPVSVHYPHGYRAQVFGGTIVSKAGASHLLVDNDPGSTSVSVTIRPVG